MNAGRFVCAITLGLLIFPLFSCVIAQDRTRQEVFDAMKPLRQEVDLRKEEWDESTLSDLLREFDQGASGEVNDSMQALVEDVAENESLPPYVRQAAVSALHLFPQATELPRVRDFLADKAVRVQAAGVLVQWGYWDEGNSMLVQHEAWRLLLNGPQDKVEPILREAAEKGSKTILGRLNAGMALDTYGDSLTPFETARTILRDYLMDGKQPADTIDLARAFDIATELIADRSESGDIPLLEAGLLWPRLYMRIPFLTALGIRAWSGDVLAKAALEAAVKSNPYPDVVEAASEKLRTLQAMEGVQK